MCMHLCQPHGSIFLLTRDCHKTAIEMEETFENHKPKLCRGKQEKYVRRYCKVKELMSISELNSLYIRPHKSITKMMVTKANMEIKLPGLDEQLCYKP